MKKKKTIVFIGILLSIMIATGCTSVSTEQPDSKISEGEDLTVKPATDVGSDVNIKTAVDEEINVELEDIEGYWVDTVNEIFIRFDIKEAGIGEIIYLSPIDDSIFTFKENNIDGTQLNLLINDSNLEKVHRPYEMIVFFDNGKDSIRINHDEMMDNNNSYSRSSKAAYEDSWKGSQSSDDEQNQAVGEKGQQYATYINSRFGFSIEYPTIFTEGEAPTNDDGRNFFNEDASIIAYGSYINIVEDNETIETYYKRELEDGPAVIAYQQMKDNWYAISYIEGSNTIYQKGIIENDIISTLIITYPSVQQEFYESIVTRVSHSFTGAQLN